MSMDISEITRKDIIDLFNMGIENPDNPLFPFRISWSGRLSDEMFLSRLYNLQSMPSTDYRFKNAYDDIHQHCTENDDWECDWVFYDKRFDLLHAPDEQLLDFLVEVFHPAVRSKYQNWEIFLSHINELLNVDGFLIEEISKISGHSVFGWKRINDQNVIAEAQAKDIEEKFDSEYISLQISAMTGSLETSPNIAIGKAKELLESCCKTILAEQHIPYSIDWELTRLMKEACESIGLRANKANKSESKAIAAKILGNLSAIANGMAELRNLYGDGHGKEKSFRSLPPRYANLAVGVSVAAVQFMWDTYMERCKTVL